MKLEAARHFAVRNYASMPELRGRLIVVGLVIGLVAGGMRAAPAQDRAMRIGRELIIGPPRVADSTVTTLPRLERCETPIPPVGYVRGLGQIAYLLSGRGTPDLATLEVRDTVGLSGAAVASIAARVLPACRFRPARRGGQRTAATVTQWLKFHATDSLIGAVPQPSDQQPPTSAGRYLTLGLLDEWPRLLFCDFRVGPAASGSYRLAFVIDTAGRVDPETIMILGLSRTGLAQHVRAVVGRCRYVSGRRSGQVTPAFVNHKFLVP